MCARRDAALGDHDAVPRRCRNEIQRSAAVDFERAQIAGVDPDNFRAELDRALKLVFVMSLDQRVEAELLGA
jgi:hypothetical protein